MVTSRVIAQPGRVLLGIGGRCRPKNGSGYRPRVHQKVARVEAGHAAIDLQSEREDEVPATHVEARAHVAEPCSMGTAVPVAPLNLL